MPRLLAILLCSTLWACSSDPPPPELPPPAAPPRVEVPAVRSAVLITVDTLRADYLGAAGGPAITPVMDRLAREGWSFESCFSAAMLTNPAMASIMTSLYPRDHGVYDNESGVADGVHTLATALERHGLRTIAVLGFPHVNPEVLNLGRGFERVVAAAREERRADETSREALAALDSLAPDERFFLWVHYVDPHAPYEPPPDHPARPVAGHTTPISAAVRASPGFQRHNPWFRTAFRRYRTVEAVRQRYIAEIEATDAGIGLLLDGLAARGRARQTAVVLTADHGENMGEHDLYFHHGGLYLPTVHVPLVVSIAGARPMRVGGQVASVDIAPTLLELLGAPRWEPMRGRSLVPVVQGSAAPRELVFSEHMLRQQVAVRGYGGTLILHRRSSRQFPSYPFEAGRVEVYDLARDPAEEHDLGPDSALGRRLMAGLRGYLGAGLHLVARRAANQDRDSLRALGYVE